MFESSEWFINQNNSNYTYNQQYKIFNLKSAAQNVRKRKNHVRENKKIYL